MDVERAPSDLQPILHQIRNLYALWTVTRDSSFYSYGLVAPAHTEKIEANTYASLKHLATHSLSLVDSFGIPDHLLAPIAINYIGYNTYKQALLNPEFAGAAVLQRAKL
jgi:hypothetical protein